jgi:hypothetical protein
MFGDVECSPCAQHGGTGAFSVFLRSGGHGRLLLCLRHRARLLRAYASGCADAGSESLSGKRDPRHGRACQPRSDLSDLGISFAPQLGQARVALPSTPYARLTRRRRCHPNAAVAEFGHTNISEPGPTGSLTSAGMTCTTLHRRGGIPIVRRLGRSVAQPG